MSRMSLASFEADKVETKFESLHFELAPETKNPDGSVKPAEVLTFLHLFRLDKATRTEIGKVQDAKNEIDEKRVKIAERLKAREDAVAEREKLAADDVPEEAWPALPELEEGDEDIVDFHGENVEYFRTVLTLVAREKDLAQKFFDYVGDDMAYLAAVFAEWSLLVMPGEAESSES